MHSPVIIAHRGLSSLYPENTLLAIEHAITAGARAVEFDVQMTADKIPVLFHDPTLERMTGRQGIIMEKTRQQLKEYHACYSERFADRFSGTPISSLEEAVDLFVKHPEVIPCLEIKRESIDYFGLKAFVDAVIRTAEPIIGQTLFLTFSLDTVEYLHSLGITQTGWVLENYDNQTHTEAKTLNPQILIISIRKLPESDQVFWTGPWQWMVYQTEDPVIIRKYIDLGADYIETDNVQLVAESFPELF